MKLKRLTIRRMPGIEYPGLAIEDIAPSLTVIEGPNASGKTSACRALRGMLWPELLSGKEHYDLQSQWLIDGELYTCTRKDRDTVWEGATGTVPAPDVPPHKLSHCFLITVDDLFDGAAETDSELARQVKVALSGGYDLEALRADDLCRVSTQKIRSVAKDLGSARGEVDRIRREYQKLVDEESSLAKLQELISTLPVLQVERGNLERASRLAVVRRELATLCAVLSAFPPSYKMLRGGEEQVAADLAQRITDQKGSLQELEQNRQVELQAISAANLPAAGIDPVALTAADAELAASINCEGELKSIAREINAARTEYAELLKSAASTAGRSIDGQVYAGFDRARLEDIKSTVSRYGASNSKCEALKAELSLLQRELQALNQEENAQVNRPAAIKMLRQWLQYRDGEQQRTLVNAFWLLVVCFVTALFLAAWLFYPPAIALSLLPIGIAAFCWRQGCMGLTRQRQACEQAYDQLLTPKPSRWSEEDVQSLLTQFERDQDAATAYASIMERCKVLKSQLQDESAELETAAAKLRERAAELGLTGASEFTLQIFAEQIEKLASAQLKLKKLESEYGTKRAEAVDALSAVKRFAAGIGRPEPQSSAEASSLLQHLKTSIAGVENSRKSIQTLDLTIKNQQQALAAITAEWTALFENLGLAPGDEAGLREMLENLPNFTQAMEEQRNYRFEFDRLSIELEGAPHLLNLEENEISELIESVQQRQDEANQAKETKAAILRALEDARCKEVLADAYNRVESLKDELRGQQQLALTANSAQRWLREIEEEYQVRAQPAVYTKAQELFSRFTHGRFELLPPRPDRQGNPEFLARDTLSQESRPPSELSRGTKMQLLLAARLAFALKAAETADVPFVLDEALSQTDPERFQAVAEVMVDLAADGRQIIYFSCRPGDAKGLIDTANERGIADAKALTLVKAQRFEGTVLPLLELKNGNHRLPRPIGADGSELALEEYCRLVGVPPFDRFAREAELHVACLVDDARTLHRLLEAGIERYGQLRQFIANKVLPTILGPEKVARIEAKAKVYSAFRETHRIGRGEPLTVEVIYSSPANSELKEKIIELAERSDWNGREVLEQMNPDKGKAVPKLRRATFQKVESFMREGGYADFRPPLDKDQSRAKVFALAEDVIAKQQLSSAELNRMFENLWTLHERDCRVQ